MLRAEFNLNNFSLWCDVAQVLKLQADNICSFAINNAVSSELGNTTKNEGQTSDDDWNTGLSFKELTTKVCAMDCQR